ncbi:hypothetical protein [Herpetosiphon geysericola]|uniref:Uncharacterized protein n=1 Tax=Herpetosiphon geysericola TaxID=70996 RepID=A0A0P6YHR9_9CHLR|nr:hypothetical protein [Herpetosiphon geysericola]KPL90012.1 hypothetical protein SE18_08655 [Herpetosiphon geysericola]
MNKRTYEYLNQGQIVTLANGYRYTAKRAGIYILFANGSVLGPYANYEDAEQAASATVNDWAWRQ